MGNWNFLLGPKRRGNYPGKKASREFFGVIPLKPAPGRTLGRETFEKTGGGFPPREKIRALKK